MEVIVVIAMVIIAIVAFRKIQDNKRKKALLLKAEQGDAQAQFEVYQMYKEDQAKSGEAMQFLEKSAENEHVEAQIELYKKEKNPSIAIEWLKKAIEQGSAEAMYQLAFCYLIGNDVIQKDMEQALIYFQKAAEQEHAEAQHQLGLCYLRGDGVKRDESKAIEWCKKAVANGSKNAQAIIGFKEIEEAPEIIKTNYIAIKDCCLELIKRGERGDGTYYRCTFEKGFGCVTFNVDSISFELGMRDRFTGSLAGYYTIEHLQNRYKKNDKLKHMIYLDKYGIEIRSQTPWTEAPPESLKICAAVLVKHGFKICDPEWVNKYPDARQYVNSVFRELGQATQ